MTQSDFLKDRKAIELTIQRVLNKHEEYFQDWLKAAEDKNQKE